MAAELMHGSQDIQTVNGQAREGQSWYRHLEKARLAAYQNLERYIASQEGHVQVDETEQLVQNQSVVGQESILPVTTEQDVRESLQNLEGLFPQMRASTIYMFWVSVFFGVVFTMILLLIWFLTPLHKKELTSWAPILWFPTEAATGEAGWQLLLWLLVGRCIANTASVQLKLDEGQLRSRDKYLLRGGVWRIVGSVHKIKKESQNPISEESNV